MISISCLHLLSSFIIICSVLCFDRCRVTIIVVIVLGISRHYREVVVVGVVIAKGIIIASVFKSFVRFLL